MTTSLSLLTDIDRPENFPVFPVCWPNRDGTCGCGRGHTGHDIGKVPLTTHGFKDATTDPKQLAEWLARWPDANYGTPFVPGVFALDIDPRSGGDNSWSGLIAEYGQLPAGPHSLTGGGGHHYLFKTDPSTPLRGGGSLAGQGWPGIEFKSWNGGYIILPPSLHKSGHNYTWEFFLALGEVPIPEAPAWLIELLLTQSSTTRRSPSLPGSPAMFSRTPERDVVSAFTKMYSEGERRPGTGLPRLIGFLRARGVDNASAVSFLEEWQQGHFSPTLEAPVIEETVNSMYHRYGSPPKEDALRGVAFLQHLRHQLAGYGADSGSHSPGQSLSPSGPETPAEVNAWALRWARMQRMENDLLIDRPGIESTGIGLDGDDLASRASLRTFTSQLALSPTFEELKPRIAPWLEIKSLKFVQALEDCKCFKGNFCSIHGLRRKTTRFACRAGWESGCLTRVGERLGRTILPDIPNGQGSYRILLFQTPYDLPKPLEGETPAQWAQAVQGVIENEMTSFQDAVARLANRKRFRGMVWARVFQQTLMEHDNYWWGWVVYKEEIGFPTGEEFAGALLELLSDTDFLFAGSAQRGDTLATLLMLLTRSWLLDFDHNSFAFEGAVNAHGTRRMFQSYSGLQHALDEAEAKEDEEKAGRPPFDKDAPYGRCDVEVNGAVCGRPLFQRKIPEGQETALNVGDKPGWASTSWRPPVSPPAKRSPEAVQSRF